MNNSYSENVKKIVNDYLEKISVHMKNMPQKDKDDFIMEIESHIYESYMNDKNENEIDRILSALNKFGDPSEVFQKKGPETMYKIGKEKNIPLYIIIGTLIAIFGLPLGFSGLGVLLGLLGLLLGILIAYFATALGFTLGGMAGIFASIIHIVDPTFFHRISGETITFSTGFFSFPNTTVEGVFGIFISLILTALGLFMFFSGKYIFRGLRTVTNLSFKKIKDIFRKKNKTV